jgi:hypothetical protein
LPLARTLICFRLQISYILINIKSYPIVYNVVFIISDPLGESICVQSRPNLLTDVRKEGGIGREEG